MERNSQSFLTEEDLLLSGVCSPVIALFLPPLFFNLIEGVLSVVLSCYDIVIADTGGFIKVCLLNGSDKMKKEPAPTLDSTRRSPPNA